MKRILIFSFIIIGVYMNSYWGTAQAQNVLNDSLLEASYNGQLNQVNELIIRGADVNAKNKEGYTALMNASLRGSMEIVNVLVASGTNINVKNSDGITALMMAAGEGHNEILQFLMNKKADVNTKADNGYTPLMFACQVGNLSAVKELLKNTIEINACSNLGATALMLATENGHTEIVKLLLEAKVDINVSEKTNGMTSLNIAAYRGYSDIVNSLLEAKANVNLANKYDMTPLYIASLNGRTEIVKELIKAGADLDKTESQNGKTALIAAAEKGYADIAKILLDNGADARIGDSFALNASAHASLKGHDTIAKYLRNDNQVTNSEQVETEERSIVREIINIGVGSRLVITGVATKSSSPAALTISDVGGLWSLEMEFPSDQIPVSNFQPAIFGKGSIHRFNGKVRFDNVKLPVFVGEGDKSNRLTFVLLKDIGYVYVRGKGKVIFPDGRTVNLE